MAPLKSQYDFYVELCSQLIRCDPLRISQSKDLQRDIDTLKYRYQKEGLAFLTKSMPALGRALDAGLVSSRFVPPSYFAKVRRGEALPAFLQGLLKRVFDSTGLLLEAPDINAIKHLRQVLFFAYKLEIPFKQSDEKAVIASFVKTETELGFTEDENLSRILDLASRITVSVFKGFDPYDVIPRHGPGAVATGERLEDKWNFSRLYNSIHQAYPYYKYYVVGGGRELIDRLEWYQSLERLESGVAKVVLVPKDSRGPRLISCEPLEYQWIQQGLGRSLARHLEYVSTYTKGRVNFTHQDVNRNLALSASCSGSFATLDLKDASDRVSLRLVRRIFRDSSQLLRCLEASRTTATSLPDGSVLHLDKFAPMGSALCFPVEAYLFWVVMVAAIVAKTRLPLRLVGKRVFVYGDDIVVPTAWASLCIQVLTDVGLRVNIDKSCITGKFRESCGLDAYDGINITPLRLHTLWSGRKSDGSALASFTALANSFCQNGYEGVSQSIWAKLDSTFGFIPYGTTISSYPCRVVNSPILAQTLNRSRFRWRINRNYQQIEFKVNKLLSKRFLSKLDGWPRLLRNIVSPYTENPSVIVVPRSMSIKRGWAIVYPFG